MQNLRKIETVVFKSYSVLHKANKQNSKLRIIIKLINDFPPWINSCCYIKNYTLKLTFYIYSIIN